MAQRTSFLILLVMLVLSSSLLRAQEDDATAEPEATQTAEATAESTAEADEDSCPALVQQALELTRQGCDTTDTNEVCYGHLLLESVLRGGVDPEAFDTPGDVVDVVEVQNLSLSALDVVAGIWGVVLMQIEAELELEDDQSDLTYIVFGDATLESASQLVSITTLETSNLRSAPSATAAIVASVPEGTSLIASGRTEDNEWLRIRLRDEDGDITLGWIFAELVETELDVEDLPVVSVDDTDDLESQVAHFGPMQAFYFRSGIDDAPCAAAPNSGMLIQTPEGQASVSLWIDEVVVELTDTAFVQAQADGSITVNVLDGAASVTANGQTRTAVRGTSVSVPLDASLSAAGEPDAPKPIDPDDLQSLPTTLLENSVTIPEPVGTIPGAPIPGSWLFTWGVNSLTCPDGSEVTFASGGTPGRISVANDGSSITWSDVTYTRAGTGAYSASFVDANGNLHQDTLTVQSLDRISGQKVVDYATTVCTLEVPFSLRLVGS